VVRKGVGGGGAKKWVEKIPTRTGCVIWGRESGVSVGSIRKDDEGGGRSVARGGGGRGEGYAWERYKNTNSKKNVEKSDQKKGRNRKKKPGRCWG